MSGIVGLWNVDGRPLDATVWSNMRAALRHRGRDGEGRHDGRSIGFACHHLWTTPEEIGEMQPLVRRPGVMLVMDGRIDNRDELLAALDLPAAVSDATCLLAAYDAWDERFAERLNGDFAIAIFDEHRQRLLLARDSIGIRPLYYFRDDHIFAFASEIKALLAHSDIPARPDDEGIADFLLVSSRPLDRQEITCFDGIFALVPAHLAVITPERMTTRRYWDFETGRPLRLTSVEEYVDAFRERFATAVRRRLRSTMPVAVSVSGGLDSSSIFCQAEILRRFDAAGAPPLVGISHPGGAGSHADEASYLLDIEREYGVEIQRFLAEPLAGLVDGAVEQITATEAPMIDQLWGLTQAVRRRAIAGGSRVLLSGHWGDQVFFSSAYLVDLFHRVAWRQVGRHLHEYVRWFGGAETRALARRLLVDLGRSHLPRPLITPLKWVRRRLFRVERPKPWFANAFLRRALRFAGRPATIGEGFHSVQARSIYLEARSKYHVHCMEWHNKIGACHGLDAALPVLDRDLLAFLMAIPGEMQNPDGVPRGLLREAMRGVLPERIRTRTGKADFSYIVNDGVARDVSAMAHALSRDSLGARMGYFEPTRLAPAVARLSDALTGPTCLASWDLADAYGLEVWLQVFFSPSGAVVVRQPRQSRENVG